jgi:hypothetical protein
MASALPMCGEPTVPLWCFVGSAGGAALCRGAVELWAAVCAEALCVAAVVVAGLVCCVVTGGRSTGDDEDAGVCVGLGGVGEGVLHQW